MKHKMKIKFEDIRLALFDIDGTLLRSDHTIPEEVISSLRNLIKIKLLSLTSARPLRSVLEFATEIGLQGPVSALNGAIVGDISGRIYKRTSLAAEITKKMIHRFSSIQGVTCNVYSGFDWFVSSINSFVKQEMDIIGFPPSVVDIHSDRISGCAEKILLMCAEEAKDQVVKIASEYKDFLAMAFSKNGYFEITSIEASKLTSAKYIADYYGITLQNCAAFGDGEVDAEIIKYCGLGIAMSNAVPKVKEVADIIIGSNEEAAVAKFISLLSNSA